MSQSFQGSGVYLIHFSDPYKHAAHYCGYAENIQKRLEEHASGHGARLTEVVVSAGIQLWVARLWPGMDRTFERRLKKHGHLSVFCPFCKGAKVYNRMKG